MGFGAIIGIPTTLTACDKNQSNDQGDCEVSPSETAGPFPIKTPAQLVRENIISDRKGIPLLINITIQNQKDNCKPLSDVFVDIWHCDSQGYYSEYGGVSLQQEDFTQHHFLRGRQTTDLTGKVSFLSIYPGWYPGRAPHIHVEVLNQNEKSLLVSQIAFPDEISDTVYASSDYKGSADTTNQTDFLFLDSLDGNMASVSGNMQDGYVLEHTIVVRT